jgi:hypothetical protein
MSERFSPGSNLFTKKSKWLPGIQFLHSKFGDCFFCESFTPKAFANFSPVLERSDYNGKRPRVDFITPKVLANALGVMTKRCC